MVVSALRPGPVPLHTSVGYPWTLSVAPFHTLFTIGMGNLQIFNTLVQVVISEMTFFSWELRYKRDASSFTPAIAPKAQKRGSSGTMSPKMALSTSTRTGSVSSGNADILVLQLDVRMFLKG